MSQTLHTRVLVTSWLAAVFHYNTTITTNGASFITCSSVRAENTFVFKSQPKAASLDVVRLFYTQPSEKVFSFSSAANPLCSLSSHNRRRRCFGPTCSSFCSCRLSSLNQDIPYIRYTGMCSAVFTLLKTTGTALGMFALGCASAHQPVY